MATVVTLWSLPPVAGGVYATYLTASQLEELNETLPANPSGQASAAEVDALLSGLASSVGAIGLVLVISLVLAYFTMAGLASAMRIAVLDAHNRPLSLGQAMAFGARKGLSMWGWYVLVTICVMVGLCLCLLPGVYLAVVFALFIPVAVFEGGGQVLGRSLRLVHRAFGAMLGRILLLGAVSTAVSLVVWQLIGSFGLAVITPDDISVATVVAEVAGSLLVSVVSGLVLSAGLLVTYAESRSGDGDLVSSEQLA